MYKEKYLKYKSKYIALKNQLGGDIRQNVPKNILPTKWKKVLIPGSNPKRYGWVEDEDTSSTQIQDIKQEPPPQVIKQEPPPQVIEQEQQSDYDVEEQW